MYDSEDLKQYHPVAQALLKPFSESEISVNQQGFLYVDPERYRRRLHAVFTEGFTFHVEDCVMGQRGVTGYGHFIGGIDGVKFDIRTFAYEKYQLGAANTDNAGKPQKEDLAVQMLHSALLKAISREIGLGLHLYYKEAKKQGNSSGGSNGGSSQSSSNSGSGGSSQSTGGNGGGDYGEWTGDVTLKTGNNAGKKWRDLPDNTVEFLAGKDNNLAKLELERRRKNATSDGAQRASESLDDTDDIPF